MVLLRASALLLVALVAPLNTQGCDEVGGPLAVAPRIIGSGTQADITLPCSSLTGSQGHGHGACCHVRGPLAVEYGR